MLLSQVDLASPRYRSFGPDHELLMIDHSLYVCVYASFILSIISRPSCDNSKTYDLGVCPSLDDWILSIAIHLCVGKLEYSTQGNCLCSLFYRQGRIQLSLSIDNMYAHPLFFSCGELFVWQWAKLTYLTSTTSDKGNDDFECGIVWCYKW